MQTIFYSKDVESESPIAKFYESISKSVDGANVIFAGGSTRKLFTGEDLGKSDIDLFFTSTDDLKRAYDELRNRKVALTRFQNSFTGMLMVSEMTPDGVKEYVFPDTMSNAEYEELSRKQTFRTVKIQLIHKECHNDVEQLLNSFDFTPTQFAYQNGKLTYTNLAFASIVTGKCFKVPTNNRANISRAVKMMRNGFKFTEQAFYETFINGRTSLEQYSDEVTINDFYGTE